MICYKFHTSLSVCLPLQFICVEFYKFKRDVCGDALSGVCASLNVAMLSTVVNLLCVLQVDIRGTIDVWWTSSNATIPRQTNGAKRFHCRQLLVASELARWLCCHILACSVTWIMWILLRWKQVTPFAFSQKNQLNGKYRTNKMMAQMKDQIRSTYLAAILISHKLNVFTIKSDLTGSVTVTNGGSQTHRRTLPNVHYLHGTIIRMLTKICTKTSEPYHTEPASSDNSG